MPSPMNIITFFGVFDSFTVCEHELFKIAKISVKLNNMYVFIIVIYLYIRN